MLDIIVLKAAEILKDYCIGVILIDCAQRPMDDKRLKKNDVLMNFANHLEEICINTVQSGKMTKDLAILISNDQEWLNTQDFLEALKVNLEEKLKI